MPVRIIRRAASKPVPPPAIPEVKTPAIDGTLEGAEAHPRGWMVAGVLLLRTLDLAYEQGIEKFLLHRVKSGVWYRLVGVMEQENRVKLVAQSGFSFDARIDSTMEKNYVMVLLSVAAEKQEPPEEVLAFVNRMLPLPVHSSATEEEKSNAHQG